MTFKRLLLARRRVDAILLALAFVAMAPVDIVGKSIFVFFMGCGVYLAAARHRSVRLAPRAFSIAVLAYALWSIGLSLGRGEPVSDNRLLVYCVIEVGFVFFPIGICLIRDPVRWMTYGARIGVLLAAILAVGQYALTDMRVGLGNNEAIFAFVAGALGIISRVPVRTPYRYLPNGPYWFYLSGISVLLSETRAAWFVYVLVALLDLVRAARWLRGGRLQAARWPAIAAMAVICLAAIPAAEIVDTRVESGFSELVHFNDAKTAETSVGIRMAMWDGASDLLTAHPFVGVGSMERIEAVAEAVPVSGDVIRSYTHLHNLFLDEALSSGFVGLLLLIGIFATFLASVYRGTRDYSTREAAFVFVLFVFTFGSFHGVMLNEQMIMTSFAFFSVLLASFERQRIARRASGRMIAAGYDAKTARDQP